MNNIWKKVVVSSLFVMCTVLLAGSAFAAEAKPTPDVIGVIDSQQIMTRHPSFEQAARELQDIVRQKEDEARTAIEKEPDQAKKRQIYNAKQAEMAREEQRLMGPLYKDCEAAVRAVAKQRNVTVVLEKSSVHFGGQDITDYVVQQLARASR